MSFSDHHSYCEKDIEKLFAQAQKSNTDILITTEKDAVKLLPLLKKNPDFNREIWVVPVEAVLSEACYTVLEQQLTELGIQIS